jgi:heavy metal sensor kinase
MNIRSIHTRLILWFTVLLIFTSIGFGAYTYYSLHHRLYEEMRETLVRRAAHIGKNMLPLMDPNSPEILAHQIQEIYSPEKSNRFIRISHIDGAILYVSGPPQDHGFDPAAISPARNYSAPIFERIESTGPGERLFLVGFYTAKDGTGYLVEMGAQTDQIDDVLRKQVTTFLIGQPFVIAIAILGGSILVRRALQPVEEIRATAEKITYSNLSQRLPVATTGDALEHLSLTLNQMLERLEHAYQQASRFSADASHELRTPLTIMRSELEALESSMRAWRPSLPFSDRIGAVLEETERLSGIVESLFALARLDAGEAKMENRAFDLSDLVRSTVEQMQLLAEEKQLSITVDAAQPVFVTGDTARLKQVVVNLYDNAIKYTLVGGAIAFSVRASGAKAVLTVTDNGVGISAHDLAHVFERFYRADKARSRATQGAGLGLSIVLAICQAHGGTAHIKSEMENGTAVTVELPLANSSVNGEFHVDR